MNKDDMDSLLEAITDRVTGDGKPFSSGTAPVTLSIGYVAKTGMCMQDGILITDAPSAVTDAIIRWVNASNEDTDSSVIRMEPGCGGLIIR